MSRNHHPRRRPGRRPPRPFRGFQPSPTNRPQGFTPPGWRQFCNIVLPFQGQEKRQFFNQVSNWAVVGAGLAGALIGWSILGLLGAVVGLIAAVSLCGQAMEKGRYIRR